MTRKTPFCLIIFILLTLSGMSFAEDYRWIRKADIPTPRWGMAVSIVNGKIYAIGGSPDNNMALSTVEEYDPETDTWTQKADMPTPRWYLTASVVNDKIYAIGGQKTDWPGTFWNVVEEYDPATDIWTQKGNMPTGTQGFTTSVVDGKIYLFGGTGGNKTLEYDPTADEWTWKTALPQPRRHWGLSSAVVDGKIYVIGGWDSSHGPMKIFSTVHEYDPATDSWEQKSDMPTARFMLSTNAVKGKIYAIGGAGINNVSMAAVEVYNPATDTWEKKSDMPNPRQWLPGVVLDGKIYLIGGAKNFPTPLSITEVYDTRLGMQVTDISPQEGPVAGGGAIAIFGSDFFPEVKVTIGGKPLVQLEVTDSLITGIIPPGTEGEQDIEIIVSDFNYSGIIGKFIYNPPSNVVVTRITPINGKQAGGDVGSVSGSGFLPGATVTIGGNQATDVGVTLTLITFTIPPGTEGTKDVVVINPNGQKDTLQDAYTYNPFPVIENLSPRYGGPLAGGTEIIITGSHFMEDVVVAIGENQAQKPDFFSSTELRLMTPPDLAGMKAVKVINPDGQEAIMEEGFTYNPAPIILSVEPNAGSLEGGTAIVIIGSGFLFGADVLIGGVGAWFAMVKSETMITAVAPPSDAGVKDVTVVNRDGQKATLKDAFTYNPAPVITGVTPDNGRLAGGTEITIQGSGFLTGAKALISTDTGVFLVVPSVQVMSATMITVITPPGKSGAKDIVVRNTDNQQATLPGGFTYNPIPTITSITPNYGSSTGGTKIAIAGTGFLQGARVMIGENAANTQLRDDTAIEAITPSLPQGVWDVRVVNPDTQEVVMSKGFISVGEVAYNYPNPFRASQGTTFRYVTGDPVQSITVKIFNLAGVPIDVVQQTDSNEVKWHNAEIHAGLYVYLMEIELEDGKMKQFRSVLEVHK